MLHDELPDYFPPIKDDEIRITISNGNAGCASWFLSVLDRPDRGWTNLVVLEAVDNYDYGPAKDRVVNRITLTEKEWQMIGQLRGWRTL